MDNETLFYLCGAVLAVSAIIVTFVGLKSDKFPGRILPLIVVWFSIFVVGASAYAVRYSTEEQEHKAHELEKAGEEIEAAEGDSGDPADAGGEEAAPEEGSQEEEPVGSTEGAEAGGDPAAGATVFADNCAGCHGEDGLGGPGGPDLTAMPLAQTEEGTVEQVTNGGGGMPPFGGQLSEEEISDVAAFVVQDVVGK